MSIELVVSAGLAVVGVVILAGWLGGHAVDPELETAGWRRTDAEVLSVLRAGDRTFLLVRFAVGSSVIRNDVWYPLAGPAPTVGRRVPVLYDPEAPARITYDVTRGMPTVVGG
jgi:hypothetical protein